MADQRCCSGWKQYNLLRQFVGEEKKFAAFYGVLSESVMKAIEEKRSNHKRQEVACMLDVLVADESLTGSEIASTLIDFVLLGFDRISSIVSFALLELFRSHSSQQQQKASVDLDSFLMEVLRFYPAPAIICKFIAEGVPLSGYFIPPQTTVLVNLLGTGRDPQRHQHPDKFDIHRKQLAYGDRRFGSNALPLSIAKALIGQLLGKHQFRLHSDEPQMLCGITMRPAALCVSVK